MIQKCIKSVHVLPPGRPSHTSIQSYLQSPSPPGRGSFSRSKVRKVRVTSMLGGTIMMKKHSRLCGYLSGKPGDSMRPVGLVKLREQSEPGVKKTRQNVYLEIKFKKTCSITTTLSEKTKHVRTFIQKKAWTLCDCWLN